MTDGTDILTDEVVISKVNVYKAYGPKGNVM